MSAETGLVLRNPAEGNFLKTIEWNKDEVTRFVLGIVNEYKGIAYTEETVQSAKKDRATLVKLKKSISDRRIQIKKEILKPYDVFEAEIKEVSAKIDDQVTEIDKQLAEYEKRYVSEKRKKIEDYYHSETSEEIRKNVPLARLFDEKWLNHTTTEGKWKIGLREKIGKIEAEILEIETSCGEYAAFAKEIYLRDLNLVNALSQAAAHREFDKKREEERIEKERRLAEENVHEAERVNDTAEAPEDEAEDNGSEAEVPESRVEIQAVEPEDKKIYRSQFTVYGTKKQLIALRQYMIQSEIRIEKV